MRGGFAFFDGRQAVDQERRSASWYCSHDLCRSLYRVKQDDRKVEVVCDDEDDCKLVREEFVGLLC